MKKLKFGSKAYRLKYLGQGKKKKVKSISRGYKMAKKKYFKKGKGSKGFLGKAISILVGAGVAVLYNVFISPMIPLGATIKNIIELVVGIFLASSKRMPMAVRAGGFALATINAYELIYPYIAGMGGIKRR